LWEFYGVDVNKVVDDFKAALIQKIHSHSTCGKFSISPEVEIVQDPEYRRLGSTIDIKKAVLWYISARYYNSESLFCIFTHNTIIIIMQGHEIECGEVLGVCHKVYVQCQPAWFE
jgi:hypothetical protein